MSFLDLHHEFAILTTSTVDERIQELSKKLPGVYLIAFGGIPFIATKSILKIVMFVQQI